MFRIASIVLFTSLSAATISPDTNGMLPQSTLPTTDEDWYTYFEEMDMKYKSYEVILNNKRAELSICQQARDVAVALLRNRVGYKIDTAGVRNILSRNPATPELLESIHRIVSNLYSMNVFDPEKFGNDVRFILENTRADKVIPTLAHIASQLAAYTIEAGRVVESNIQERGEIRDAIKNNLAHIEPVFVNSLEGVQAAEKLEITKLKRLEYIEKNLRSMRPLLEQILEETKSIPTTVVQDPSIKSKIMAAMKSTAYGGNPPTLDGMKKLVASLCREARYEKAGSKATALTSLSTVDELIKLAEKKAEEINESKTKIHVIVEELSSSLTQIRLYK